MKFLPVLILAGLAGVPEVRAASPEGGAIPTVPGPGKDVAALIEDLGDENFRTRENASREIWELGEAALPALEEAADSQDPEREYRARDLLRKIQLHITPETDPSVTALVERYLKASPSEKASLLGKMKGKRAWRQMLKLFADETQPELREKLAAPMNGIAVRAARERMLKGDDAGAREYLEMAPADAEGLLALAEYHRSHGTLGAELKRAKAREGRKAAAWRLALERAGGDLKGAREAAENAGLPRIAEWMAAMSGDPLPWLRDGDFSQDDPIANAYAEVAVKRWLGGKVGAKDLEKLERSLGARNGQTSGAAMNALFLLGEIELAEPAFAEAEPLDAFRHFEALERIPDALAALGLDPDEPDYAKWVSVRLTALERADIAEQHEVSTTGDELVTLANFLERRGQDELAARLFEQPLLAWAGKDPNEFSEFLGSLFGGNQSLGGAPRLARRIGVQWAGDDERRWGDIVVAAFGDDDQSSAWWDWLPELDPKAERAERFDGMLALFRLGDDPGKLRARWLGLAWKAVDEAPENQRLPLVERISELVTQTGDVENSTRAWRMMPEGVRDGIFWGQQVVHFSAQEKWDDAADVILGQIEAQLNAKQEPGAELYAYAAAALRRAGRENEALVHDAWADKLYLGDATLAMRIGNGYAYGRDYQRAGDWWARAAREVSPESSEFPLALKLHSDALLEEGRWTECAAVSEVLARVYAASDLRWNNPLPFMRQRLQADTARALAMLGEDRAGAVELLGRCHRDFATDGSLADFFFPALRKAGLMKEHDRWFDKTWELMNAVIEKYPNCHNTLNTTAWFASRSCRQLDAAEKLLKRALAANPEQSAYLDTMAEIQFARGDRKKALEWSNRAVNFTPDDAQLRRQQNRFRNDPLPNR